MGKWTDAAMEQRKVMDAAGAMLTDAEASTVPTMYSELTYSGELIQNGTRINWGGVLKRAAVDLWDREENNPDNAPDLWDDIPYKDGFRIIPEVITVGKAFALDEIGWWKDVLYISKLEANTYTPEQYPRSWEIYNV